MFTASLKVAHGKQRWLLHGTELDLHILLSAGGSEAARRLSRRLVSVGGGGTSGKHGDTAGDELLGAHLG